MEIQIHRRIPSSIGFQPADFIFSVDSPVPIKNKVNTNNDLDIVVTPSVIADGMGIYVLMTIAKTNRKIK